MIDSIAIVDFINSFSRSYKQGLVIKHVTHYPYGVPPAEDLKKARFYLQCLIEEVEGKTKGGKTVGCNNFDSQKARPGLIEINNWLDYQRLTQETSVYSDANTGSADELKFLGLYLASCVGEVAKAIASSDGLNPEQVIIRRIGRVMRILSQLCNALDVNFTHVCQVDAKEIKTQEK